MFFILFFISLVTANTIEPAASVPTQSCSDLCLNIATDTYTRCNCYRDLNSCGVSYDCMTLEITACDNIHCHFCSSVADLMPDGVFLLFGASILILVALI